MSKYAILVKNHPFPEMRVIGPFDNKEKGEKALETFKILWKAKLVKMWDWDKQ